MKLLEDFWISQTVELNSYNWMGGINTGTLYSSLFKYIKKT